MPKNRLLILPLALALATGCMQGAEGENAQETDQDGTIPEGAIPAAPDALPGTESAPGGVQLPGTDPAQAGDPAKQGSGAAGPGAIDTAAAATRDTLR